MPTTTAAPRTASGPAHADDASANPDTFAITPLGDALGAQIDGLDLNRPLTEAGVAALEQAWDRHLVLRFRGQQALSVESHIRFSRYFGPLDKRPIAARTLSDATAAWPQEIVVISNVLVEGKPIGGLGDGESIWHADMTYQPQPPRAALLHAHEVPASGGDTQFLNLYLAYETLPDALRLAVEGRSCVHDASRNSAGELRLGFAAVSDPRETVGAVHSLVRVHPVSGRKSLYLGRRRNAYISGLPLPDSEAVLDALWQHATQERFTWRQQWQAGDLVAWDNRVTLHRRDAFDPLSRRLMLRTQVGDRAH